MLEFFADFLPAIIQYHSPALVVVIPLISATLLMFLRSGFVAWLGVVAVNLACFVLALSMAASVSEAGTYISYAMGGWAPPIGIEFRIDSLNSLILCLVTGIGVLAAIFSWPSVQAEINARKHAYFYAAYLICFAGLSGVAITGDAFNLFVFLEISSISTYALVSMGGRRDRRAYVAAFNYLTMGTIGATFFVIGVGFLFAATGTLNMADMADKLVGQSGNRAVQAGFAFIVVGLGVKAAMWPLHQWLPNAYAYSPSFVSVFLSATATKVALYALIRFVFSVFPDEMIFDVAHFTTLLMPLALAAMVFCSFQAIFQHDVRRMLAYSSVAQVGYMLLGISLGTAAGLSAGLLHLFNHALMKGALFMALGGIVLTYQGTRLNDFYGLGRSAPFTMVGFAIAGLSLIGVPLTAGFQSKFALIQAVWGAGWTIPAVLIVVSSALALIYMGRLILLAFFYAPINTRKVRKEAPLMVLIPLWVLALANIYFGVYAVDLIGWVNRAALGLVG